MTNKKIGLLVGSLRAASYSRKPPPAAGHGIFKRACDAAAGSLSEQYHGLLRRSFIGRQEAPGKIPGRFSECLCGMDIRQGRGVILHLEQGPQFCGIDRLHFATQDEP